MVEAMRVVPNCVGDYQSEETLCNGNPRAEDERRREPCPWRDRCVALGLHLRETGADVSALVTQGKDHGQIVGNPKEFRRTLDRIVSEQDIRDGRVRARPRRKPTNPKGGEFTPEHQSKAGRANTKATMRAATRASIRALDASRETSGQLVQWFLKRLSEALKLPVSDRVALAKVGELFMVDRIQSSGYMSLYGKGRTGRIALASIWPKPRTETVELRLAATPEALADLGLEARPIADGAFRSRLPGLKKSGLSAAAKALASLVESGGIRLA